MSKSLIAELGVEFATQYDADAKDRVWVEQSEQFRRFWKERVRASNRGPISDDDCDKVIRILDRNGKGNTKGTEAIARVMVPQGAWRKMFNELHVDSHLSNLVDAVLTEEKSEARANLINKLYAANTGRKNRLTGKSGNTICAFLAAYDPMVNLSIISLSERKALIDFLNIQLPFNWESAAIGTRIALTNDLILNALHEAGVAGSARTVSRFCYWDKARAEWQREHAVKRADKTVIVTVPDADESDDEEEEEEPLVPADNEIRESLQIQALLAEIGCQMGFTIWLPRSDRQRVLRKWNAKPGELLDELPLSYDATTMRTVEEIDVIWLRRRSIVRAFEVEDTTSVYSGLLRMADLVALQPNINIRLHIVAPATRRAKVFRELRRPVFSLLEGRPLSEICTFISYDKVRDLREEKLLAHLSDDVLKVYEEASLEEE